MSKGHQEAARRRVAMNARRLRDARGWTQEFAAERVGCSVQALQRFERAAAAVTVDFVSRVAETYGCDLGEMFVVSGPWKKPVAGRPLRAAAEASPLVGRAAKAGRRKR